MSPTRLPGHTGRDLCSSDSRPPRRRQKMEPAKSPIHRCAIYTRKSSEEGLEQDFNSLHAQREACEAFVASQSGEGWRLIRTAYDDGGLSGVHSIPPIRSENSESSNGSSACSAFRDPTV